MAKGKTLEEKAEDYRQQIKTISATILDQMQQVDGNWEMPWYKGIPYAQNMFTGRHYGGNNLLILWDKCLQSNYKYNQWATAYQWRKVRAMVKKGEKGTLICVVIPNRSPRTNNNNSQINLFEYLKPDEINSQHTYFRFTYKYLFNESQVNGYFGNQPDLFNPPIAGEVLMKQLIEKSCANIKTGGDRAFYSMYSDEIQMPEMARFRATNTATIIENYYVTIIHELIHWTAHETRCSREMLSGFGTPKYAFEELIAELGSALLCTQLNQKVVPMVDHAQYLNNWLKVLKNDFSYFTEALELARTAIYFLNDLTGIYPFLKPQHKRKINDDRVANWSKLAGVVNDKAI